MGEPNDTDYLFAFHRLTISELRRDIGNYAYRLDWMESVACGWAFDAGVREAERDEARREASGAEGVATAQRERAKRAERERDEARRERDAERSRCLWFAERADDPEDVIVAIRIGAPIPDDGAPAPREG